MSDHVSLTLTINGQVRTVEVPAERTLLEVLRDELRLTGVKRGCDQGSCGACTVLVDGVPRLSCITLAATMNSRSLTTIEGLESGGVLHPIQQALVDQSGLQCGFCIPGIVMTAKALLDETPSPTVDEIREALGSNICRCTGYVKIVNAIASLSQEAQS